MLVLTRKAGERIWIGDDISVTVVRVTGGGVRLGIEAPHELPVVREELKQRLLEEISKPLEAKSNSDAERDASLSDSGESQPLK